MGGTEKPLTVYVTVGIKAFIETTLTLSQSYLTFTLQIIEIDKVGFLFEQEGMQVCCEKLSHPVPCFCYRITEDSHAGKLNAEKLIAENIPNGPWLQQLKKGKTIELPYGRVIDWR